MSWWKGGGGDDGGTREEVEQRERGNSWRHPTRRNGLLSFCLSLLGMQKSGGSRGERQTAAC